MTNKPNDSGDGPKVYSLPHPETGEILDLPRVTQVIGRASKYPLERWKRMIVASIIANDDTLRTLALTNPYQASDEAVRRGPLRGTAMHGVTELIDMDVDVPTMSPEFVSMGSVYEQLMEGIQILHREVTLVNLSEGYAGTTDKIIDYGGLTIVDVKTSKSVYADVAMQLAAYANAEFIWTGSEYLPMPDVRKDVALVANIRIDGGDLVPVRIEDAYQGFLGMLHFAKWQDGSGKKAVQKPIRSSKPIAKPAPVRAPVSSTLIDDLPPFNGGRTTEKPEEEMTAPKLGNTINEEVTLNKWKDLFERMQAMKDNKPALAYLKDQWPFAVPTFKAVREGEIKPTDEDVEKLSKVITLTENKFTEPFPNTQLALPVQISDFEYEAIEKELTSWQLEHPHHTVAISQIQQDAKNAGKSLRMCHEKRIMCILQGLAALGDATEHADFSAIVKAGAEFVTDSPVNNTGETLGNFTYDQAEDFLALALAFGDSFVLQYDESGKPSIIRFATSG